MHNKQKDAKFIFIIGGVISGLGKGIFTASLGKVLQMAGYNVNLVKVDPYLNVDAGTMRPTEHGEVWVTYDGGEIDQDLGNYERFLHKKISKDNNITSGKLLLSLIEDERSGKFLGKTVQYIPHATNKIAEILTNLHHKNNADITIVEIGGTVGDYESSLFLHAIARMQKKYRTSFVFMGYLLYPPHIGELKTKPFQHALTSLFSYGIHPNIIVLSSPEPIDDARKQKIATVANISTESLIELPDIKNIYEIPKLLASSTHALNKLLKPLGFTLQDKGTAKNTGNLRQNYTKYSQFLESIKTTNNQSKSIDLAIVGKYLKSGHFMLKDTYISVLEAINYAS